MRYGYKKEELVGKSLLEFIPEKYWPMISRQLADLAEGKSTRGEVEFNTKQGTVMAEFRSSPLKKRGRIVGFQSVVRDITQQKLMEEELRESEEKYGLMFENSPDGIITLDHMGNITSVNDVVLSYGYKREELVEKNWLEFIPEKRRSRLDKHVADVTTGTSTQGEMELNTPKGRLTMWFRASPIEKRGEIVGFQIILIDITKRKRAEARLHESEERLRQLIEYAPDAIYINDLNGNFVDGNKQAEKTTGYKKEELIGKSMLEVGLLPEKYIPKALESLEKNMRGQRTGSDEFELTRKDGSTVTVEISTFPVKREGKVEVIGIARDITERKKTEESMNLLSTAVRTSVDAINVASPVDGKLLFCNGVFLKQWKVKGDYHNLTYVDCFDADEDTLNKATQATMAGGWAGELTAKAMDGQTFPVLVASSPVVGKKGKTIGLLGIFKDITERKKMEEKLRESEERLRNLYESVPDALAVYVGREGHLLEYNKAFNKWSGYPDEELKDKIYLDFVHPDDRAMVQKKYRTKYPEEELPLVYEIKSVNKKGESFPTEISVGLYKKRGRVIGINVMHRDITERKEMEKKLTEYSQHLEEMVDKRTRELKESEAKLKDLFKTIPDSIAIVDLNGNLLEFNEATLELFGYTREEIIGKNVFDFVAEEDLEKVVRVMKQTLDKGFVRIQFSVLGKDGRKIPVELNASVLKDPKGNLVGLVAVLRDITERKRMEEQLLKSERLAAIGQLATMVGHDLRNPLSAIQNACYYVKTKFGASKDEKLKKMFKVVGREINHANSIVKDLLDFSRVKKPELKKVDLISSIRDALTQLKFPENITLTTKYSKIPTIEADPNQLRRVLQNIALNGVQAMPNGGELTVSTRKNGDFVEVAFTDTGVGIPEENMKKLFTPLFTTKAQGVGLGLAICKNLVESHNGRIVVKSKVGEGSTFTVKLPIHQNKGGEKQT